jgi:hypothetical protein
MSKIQKYTEINTTEQEQKEQSTVLALETLTKEYDVVLAKYIQAQTDYITSLNQEKPSKKSKTKGQRKMITNQGTAFWGMYGISEEKTMDVNKCAALCSTNPKCTGATFNSVEQNCRLRGGMGDLVAASKNEFSIVQESISQLSELKKINERLIQINNEITELISTNMPLYNENKQEMGIQNDTLKKNYYKLTADKLKIEEKIKENESLQRKQENNALVLNSNHSKYTIYFFIVIGLIVLISMIMMFTNNNSSIDTPMYMSTPTESFTTTTSPFGDLFNIFILLGVFVLIYYFYNKVM